MEGIPEVLPNDTLLVGFDLTHGKENRVLIVARKPENEMIEVINAFEGDEAEELYKKLAIPRIKLNEDRRN